MALELELPPARVLGQSGHLADSNMVTVALAEVEAVVDDLTLIVDTFAILESPEFTGVPTAPTASLGTNTTQLASTEFVRAEVAALVDTAPALLDTLNELAAAIGDDPSFAVNITDSVNLKAPIADPTFTGTVTVPTPFTIGAVSMVATGTELNFVDGVTSAIQDQLDDKAPLSDAALKSVLTTKGDIYVATAAGTLVRLGAGPDGYVLTADTAEISGLKYALAAAGATGGGINQAFYENDVVVNTDYTITASKNAMTAGPISIDPGITVTVGAGSVWTIV